MITSKAEAYLIIAIVVFLHALDDYASGRSQDKRRVLPAVAVSLMAGVVWPLWIALIFSDIFKWLKTNFLLFLDTTNT